MLIKKNLVIQPADILADCFVIVAYHVNQFEVCALAFIFIACKVTCRTFPFLSVMM